MAREPADDVGSSGQAAADRAAELRLLRARLDAGERLTREDIELASRRLREADRRAKVARNRAANAHQRAAQAHRVAAEVADDADASGEQRRRADEEDRAAAADRSEQTR